MPLRIEKLVYGGDGLARDAGLVWFVPFSAPGDLVEIEETALKSSYHRGKIRRILEESPLRTEALCPWFGSCGGCQWQHIQYPAQLSAKKDILVSMATRDLVNPPEEVEIFHSPAEWEYRCRISLHRREKEIGYFAAGSRDLVPIQDCPIAESPLRSWLQELPLSFREIENLPERFELRSEEGTVRIVDTGKNEAFQQVNSLGNSLLKDKLRSHILGYYPEPRIFDLFCGNGNLSLPLSDAAESISAWDVSAEAIEAARKAGGNDSRLHYSRRKVSAVYGALRKEADKTDVLILDPPRKGVKNEAPFLAKLRIPLVAYVSCNPASLMRDLKVFEKAGYRLEHLEAFDMFPQTYHLESLALLSLR